jgi:disulfide bond formation protein DsbB
VSKHILKRVFSTPFIFLALVLFSIAALASALIAQYAFGLHPCQLCIYQRVPFVVAILIGLCGLYAERKNFIALRNGALGLLGLTFLANTVIAGFHTGVERKWWKGLEGCSAPDMTGSMAEILERIKSAPIARCDEIPWADPILGLSMANYNSIFCLGVAVYCAIVFTKTLKHKEPKTK